MKSSKHIPPINWPDSSSLSALGDRSETSGKSRTTLEVNVPERTDQSEKPQGMTQGGIATVDSMFDGEHHAIECAL
jgi:hypothetical protein